MHGEHKANMLPCHLMARRPEFPAGAMTPEQLRELRRSLLMLSPHSVRANYEEALSRCVLRNGSPPPPWMIQELVTLWKVLWKWRT